MNWQSRWPMAWLIICGVVHAYWRARIRSCDTLIAHTFTDQNCAVSAYNIYSEGRLCWQWLFNPWYFDFWSRFFGQWLRMHWRLIRERPGSVGINLLAAYRVHVMQASLPSTPVRQSSHSIVSVFNWQNSTPTNVDSENADLSHIMFGGTTCPIDS